MRRKLFRAVWFVVVPLLVLRVWCDRAVQGWWVDTSASAAERIKPGMTLTEAEQIVGGPPGEYCLAPPTIFRCWFSGRTPRWVVWRTAREGIDIDADSLDGTQTNLVVRYVHHWPDSDLDWGNLSSWDEIASWGWRAVVCFAAPFVLVRLVPALRSVSRLNG